MRQSWSSDLSLRHLPRVAGPGARGPGAAELEFGLRSPTPFGFWTLLLIGADLTFIRTVSSPTAQSRWVGLWVLHAVVGPSLTVQLWTSLSTSLGLSVFTGPQRGLPHARTCDRESCPCLWPCAVRRREEPMCYVEY